MGWIRSSRCDSNACIEVWPDIVAVGVRDSTQPETPLVVPFGDWWMFVAAVKSGLVGR